MIYFQYSKIFHNNNNNIPLIRDSHGLINIFYHHICWFAPVRKAMWCHASDEFVKPIWGRYNSMISYIYIYIYIYMIIYIYIWISSHTIIYLP